MASTDSLEFKPIAKGVTSGWVDHAGIVVRSQPGELEQCEYA